MLGVIFPVCCQMQNTAFDQFLMQLLAKLGLYYATLMVFLFMPGVGKEDLNAIEAIVWNAFIDDFHCIMVDDTQVG